nr:right-handed parallel beta-helix repeat-containing protein [uncultured Devosia sp.]
MYQTSWLALVAALGALAPASALARDASPRVELQLKAAEELGAGVGLFVPFVLGDGTVVFGDGWLDYGPGDQFAASLGGGVRQQVGDWVIGANAHFDFLHSAHGFSYQQIAAGLELLGEDWEFRINGAAPLRDRQNEYDPASAAKIVGGSFVINQGYEVALYSVNAEVGYRVPIFADDSGKAWKVYAGTYALGSAITDTVVGLSLRSELTLQLDQQMIPGATLSLGGGLRHDSLQQTSANAYIRFSAPIGGAPAAPSASSPLFQRVERNPLVNTALGAFGADEAAVSSTGSGRVQQISSANGSAAQLNALIAAAGTDAIILASGDLLADSALTLMAGQILVGGGGVVNLTASDGQVVRYANPGSRTTIYGGSNGQALMNARLAAPTEPDVLVLADGSTVSTLSIIGGNNAIVANGVNNVTIDNVSISNVGADGIVLVDASNVTITNSTISKTFICESSFDCEFSIYDPESAPYAAISAIGVTGLTIGNVDIAEVTYGIFIAPDFNEDGEIVNETGDIRIDNVRITNSRREGVHIVSAENVALNQVHIDNLALDRSMDLMVLMNTQHLTLTNSSLKGGINGLMFAYASNLEGDLTSDMTISNLDIVGSDRSGIFMNPSSNIRFSDIRISDVGFFGLHLYGSDWGGGPVSDIQLDTFSVDRAGRGAMYFDGPIENIHGNISASNVPAGCTTNTAGWSSSGLTQAAGNVLSVNGSTVSSPSDCSHADPY